MADHTTATEREAIAAMKAAEERWLAADDADFFDQHRVAAMLTAIPGDVHARLATEKGALEPWHWWHVESYEGGMTRCNHSAQYRGGECGRETGDWQPLYRLVDPPRPEDNDT